MSGRNGDTLHALRELIAAPPAIEAVLLAYAEQYPEEVVGIHGVLKFRRRVPEEFERHVTRPHKDQLPGQ